MKVGKSLLSKAAGLTALTLLLYATGFTQSGESGKPGNEQPAGHEGETGQMAPDNGPGRRDNLGEYDEIIIKRKGDKDAKVTIEIRDGKVFADGKPVSDYENEDLSVRRKKIPVMDGIHFAPFPGREGALSYGGGAPAVQTAFLGVYTEKAEKEGAGAKIKEVTKGSAAEKAGLQKGDIITKVDEIKIDGPEDLPEAIHQYKPEDKVLITYLREGREMKANTVLGGMAGKGQQPFIFSMPDMGSQGMENFNFDFRNPPPPNGPEGPFGRFWGEPRPKLGIHAQDTEDGKGVKVLEVDAGSPADKAGIKKGDIITRFDGKEVNSAQSLVGSVRANSGKTALSMSLTRDGKSRELELKIPKRLKTADL